jgi:hypothetical protein
MHSAFWVKYPLPTRAEVDNDESRWTHQRDFAVDARGRGLGYLGQEMAVGNERRLRDAQRELLA